MGAEEERVDEPVDERSVDDLLSFINGDGGMYSYFFYLIVLKFCLPVSLSCE